MKIQPMTELFAVMRAVARGKISAPADAAMASAEPGAWPAVLDDQQWDKFTAELDHPPVDNPALRSLLKRKPAWEAPSSGLEDSL